MKVRICPKCGKHNPENSWSCEDCGETLPMNTLVDTEDEQAMKVFTDAKLASQLQEEKAAKEKEAAKIKLQEFRQKPPEEQNFTGGWVAGSVAALICAIAWALLTVSANRQIGWMAIGVGYLVGSAVRWKGKGIELKFGIMGEIISAFSCLAGNVLASAMFFSQQSATPLINVLLIAVTTPLVLEIVTLMFSPIDLLFYSLAIIAGYRFSFRSVTQREANYVDKLKSAA